MGTEGKRTLFSIDCVTGVKIQHLSAYPTEAEVLLAAGTRFVVTQTITNGDLTIVTLKAVSSGLPPRKSIPPVAEPELEPEPEPEPIRTLAALSAERCDGRDRGTTTRLLGR